MTLGGAAQVAAAHCPNEQTLDPQSAAITYPPVPQPAAQWFSPRNVLRQRLTILVTSITGIATYLPTPEGGKAELVRAP